MTVCSPGRSLRVEESADTFLAGYLASRPEPMRRVNERYLDSGVNRHEIAEREATTFGAILRAFNETAVLSSPHAYVVRGRHFHVRYMHALCDDFHGDRFGAFGEPLTLRMFMDERSGLPAELFRIADWNFMDAGLPYFVGYAYGSRLGDTLCLSGIQSDIAQRYGYLFQRGGTTSVRDGDAVVERCTADLAERYGRYVPLFRRAFQRHWIPALLGGVVRACRALGGIEGVALHQFPLEPDEARPGSVVFRVYVGLPRRLPGETMHVVSGARAYRYHRVALADVERYVSRTP